MKQFEEKLNIGKGEKDLFAKWQAEGLSITEKSDMRIFLQEKVATSSGLAGIIHSFLAPFQMMSFRQATSMAAIAVIVIASTGVGVAKASEKALPGDALYVIKTVVNEPISGLLKRTPEEKAAWAKALSERRMEEASELAASGNLGEDETKKIESLIEKHHDSLKEYEDGDDDTFARDLDDHSERLELKIEVREDGKRKYEVRERRHSEDERDDKSDDLGDDARFDDESDGNLEDEKDRKEDLLKGSVGERKQEIKKGENRSEKKKEESKSVKKSSKSESSESASGGGSSSKEESSGNDSSKDDDSKDDSEDDKDDDSDKSGKDEDSDNDQE